MGKKMTRRDKCYFTGRRAHRLNPLEAARAWRMLAQSLESMGDSDIPKFAELLKSIRMATIISKRASILGAEMRAAERQ